MSPELVALLSLLVEGKPFPVHVRISPDDEVLSLRQRVQELTDGLESLKRDYHRVEYLYRCETTLNLRLIDMCRANGIKLPRSFFKRPFEL